MPPPYDLYELAVTNAGPLARFLVAALAKPSPPLPSATGSLATPRSKCKLFAPYDLILREDFSGSAALARAFAKSFGMAIAVDHDPQAIAAAAAKAAKRTHFRAIESDVMTCREPADIIAATNFALGYFHERAKLIDYLVHSRRCLRPGGILCADLYGGGDAFTPHRVAQSLKTARGKNITYIWEQVAAFPQTGLVHNAIHFRVPGSSKAQGARPTKLIKNAFTYHWRLWSIPELRDAMYQAGYSGVDIYDRLGGAIDQDGRLYARPLEDTEPMDDPYVVYVIARK